MGSRDTLIAYYKRRRKIALAKMVHGSYTDEFYAAEVDVAHYDKLIERFER